MSLHPVRLPGLGGRRRHHRVPRRAGRPRPQIRATIPGRGRSGPFHVQRRARGEPGLEKGETGTPGLGMLGSPRREAGVRSRSPPQHGRDVRCGSPVGLPASGSLAAAGTAHLAPGARTVGAPPPGPAAASCGASGEVAAVAGEAVVFARGRGQGWLRARLGECYVGRRAPSPLPGRTRRRGGGEGRRARARGVPTSPPLDPLCADRRWRRPGGTLCPHPAGMGTGAGRAPPPSPGVPLPGLSRPHPPQLRRALRRPRGLGSCWRRGGGGGSRSPATREATASRSRGRRGPLTIRPGAARARAPLHFLFAVAAALQARGSRGRPGAREAGRCWVTGGESRSPPAAQASSSG